MMAQYKTGETIEAINFYDVEWEDKIGFKGGKEVTGGDVRLCYDTELFLLNVGEFQSIARIEKHTERHPFGGTTRKHEGLVFKIPTKVLIKWHDDREKEELERAEYKKKSAEREKNLAPLRAKWC